MDRPRTRTVIEQTTKILIDLGPLPANRHLETVWVRRKKDGKHIQVNLKDFGYDEEAKRDREFPKRHFELAPDYDPMFDEERTPRIAEVESAPKLSEYSDDDLRQLHIRELKTLPEWDLLDRSQRFANVGEVAESLIRARAALNPKADKKTRKPKVPRETLGSGGTNPAVGS